VDVAHHIVNDGKVLMYFTDRRDGVDLTESLDNCHICRSENACKLFQVDVGTDTETGEDTDTTAHADEKPLITDGGIDIVEKDGIDPDNAVNISLMFDGYDWCVSFNELSDWSQNDLEPWLENRLDVPNTVEEAKNDDRVYVPDKEHVPPQMRDVTFRADILARGEYDSETGTWTVDVLTDGGDE